jgi:arsenite methyltransferase
MATVLVFDKPMCCSTGVCGPDVDPVLPQFAADLEWLKGQGCQVARFNLAQHPQAFIENQTMHALLSTEGTDCLSVVIVDGQIVSRQVYPLRDQLLGWCAGATASKSLPLAGPSGGCCGTSGCC